MITNYKTVEKILNLKQTVVGGCKEIKFVDLGIEKEFQNYYMENNIILVKIAFCIFLSIHILSIIFQLLHFETNFLLYISFGLFTIDISLIFVFIKKIKRPLKCATFLAKFLISLLDLILLIFFSIKYDISLNLTVKVIFIFIILKNLGYLLFPRECLIVLSILTIWNLVFIGYLNFLLKKDFVFLYLEFILELGLTFCMYFTKNALTKTIRKFYIEKHKFEKFFNFCDELIGGLNGFHVSYIDGEFSFINKNLKKFLDETDNSCEGKK